MELISRPPRIRHAKAPRQHSQQHFAFPRRCQARAKLYVGAHKAVRGERPGRANGVDSLVARKPPRDDLIIGWRTSMVGREVDRDGRPTSGGSGLYPGGKSPGRNQHDHGERPPTHAPARVYVQCYRNHFGITFRGIGAISIWDVVPGYQIDENRGRTPRVSRFAREIS